MRIRNSWGCCWNGGRDVHIFIAFASWNLPGCPSKMPRKIPSCLGKGKGKAFIWKYSKIIFHQESLLSRLPYLGQLPNSSQLQSSCLTYGQEGGGRLRNICGGHSHGTQNHQKIEIQPYCCGMHLLTHTYLPTILTRP